jgi:benzaldehyde dehydrogenase (NAD)
VRRIRDEGVTILLVEQNIAKALAIADGAYVIERGAVVMKGAAADLLRSPQLRAAYLGAENKPGSLNWKGGLFMSTQQTTAVTIAAEHAWKGKIFTGRWQAAKGGVCQVIEPATGNVLTEVGLANADDVREAARSAAAAQGAWADTPAEQRAAVLRRAAQLLEANADALRPWIVRETGCIPPKADFELHFVANVLIEAAAIATQPPGLMLPSGPKRMSFARRVPHGVVGVISPFNFPLILSTRAVAPALALGNAVVLKPDPQTPVTGGFILARLFEAAGLPAGLLHVLPGGAATGEALVSDPDVTMISFTGSTAAGRKVGEMASRHLKKVTLELGGKNCTIVLDDADLDVAASSVAWSCYLHQGQICMATGSVLAHHKIARELTERLVEKARHLPVGDPHTAQVALGPLINQRQLERVDGIVKDAVAKGAKVRAGGTYEKLFYKPTVLDEVQPGMRVMHEEVFGPVVAVLPFESDADAIRINNSSEYGLSRASSRSRWSARWTSPRSCAPGSSTSTTRRWATSPGFLSAGRGASGNGGRHGGAANWEEFTQWQWVTIQDRATRYPF